MNEWHLTKTVSLSIIGALLFYGGVFVWYASEMNQTVQQHGEAISDIRSEQAAARRATNDQAVQLARIEENTRNLSIQIDALIRQNERRLREEQQ